MIGIGRTIEDADGVGFDFDDELLDDVLDDFLAAGGHFVCAIVFVSGELALDEDLRAFDKTAGQSFKIWPKTNDLVPLAFLLPLVVLVLPRFLGRDAELSDGSAVGVFAGGIVS